MQPDASEPITLTDPDGSVTRVASWSSWTREQIRAPGGEPLLVTRIDRGQLWFAAGRRRSPWRHEVVAGPATVTTARGRFHVTAEDDGGATVACLAGRTRVRARLSEPVIVGPDQVASVSADGTTVIVTDPLSSSPGERAIVEATLAALALDLPPDLDDDLTDDDEPQAMPAVTEPAATVAASGSDEAIRAAPAAGGDEVGDGVEAEGDVDAADTAEDGGAALVVSPTEEDQGRDARSVLWLPEIVAVAAMLGVLIAAAIIFGRGSTGSDEVVAPRPPIATTLEGSTAALPTTAAATTDAATIEPPATEPATTAAPATVAPTTAALPPPPPALTAPATATGRLTACRRADGGVRATVTVSHQSGGAGRFAVEVGLVDGNGVFAQAVAQSAEVPPGGSTPVEVLVPVSGPAGAFCELLSVNAA